MLLGRSSRGSSRTRRRWKRLAECTLCPNVYYEPQLLIPAFEHLREPGVRVAIVTSRPRANPKGPVVVCGVFPLRVLGGRSPWKIAKFWHHPLCFLTTPLIRADFGSETLNALVAFLRRERIGLVMGQQVSAEGPFHHQVFEFFHRQGLSFVVNDIYRRPFLCRKPTRKHSSRHGLVGSDTRSCGSKGDCRNRVACG